MADAPEGFDRVSLQNTTPVWAHRCAARFQDVDAAGIVFFARLFDYFHDAYLAFMEVHGLPHANVLRERIWGAPIRHAEADFMSPIRFADPLEVGLVRAAWRGSELIVGYRISIEPGRVAAVGNTRHVIVNFPEMSRIEPPRELRAVFDPLVSR